MASLRWKMMINQLIKERYSVIFSDKLTFWRGSLHHPSATFLLGAPFWLHSPSKELAKSTSVMSWNCGLCKSCSHQIISNLFHLSQEPITKNGGSPHLTISHNYHQFSITTKSNETRRSIQTKWTCKGSTSFNHISQCNASIPHQHSCRALVSSRKSCFKNSWWLFDLPGVSKIICWGVFKSTNIRSTKYG